jgi:hypothetical protein
LLSVYSNEIKVTAQAESIQMAEVNSEEALLDYQESTSEDEQIEDELIPSHSEHEDYMFSDEDDDEEDDGDENSDDLDDAGEFDDKEDNEDEDEGDSEDDDEDDEEIEKDKILKKANNRNQLARRKNVIDQYLPKTDKKVCYCFEC